MTDLYEEFREAVKLSPEQLSAWVTDNLAEMLSALADQRRYRYLRDEMPAGDWHLFRGPYSQMLLMGQELDDRIDRAIVPLDQEGE